MNDIHNRLNDNLSNWETLGKIKQSEKIEVSKSTAYGMGKVSISEAGIFQGISRTFNKAFTDKIADSVKTTKWIGKFQNNTLDNLENLHSQISNAKNINEIMPIMDTLTKMQKAISASNVGLLNLSNTYSDSKVIHTGTPLKDSILQKIEINNILMLKIDEIIVEIENQAASKSIKEVMSSSDSEGSGVNSAQAGAAQVIEYAKGKGLNTELKDVTDKSGNSVRLPRQFSVDLPRSPYITVNDQLIYSSRDRDNYDEVSAYQSLKRALGDSDRAVQAVMNLTTQGMFADSLAVVMKIGEEKLGMGVFPAKDNSLDFQYNIHISGDVVTLELKNSYALRDDSGNIQGYQLTKREFQLSLDELQHLDPADPESTLQTVNVKDTYSDVITDRNLAIAMYPRF